MSAPSQEPLQPLTLAQIDAWRHRASLKYRQLLLHGTDPARDVREQAFQEMGELCLDALEEVRVISTHLREESEAARIKAGDILAASARLLAQHTKVNESQILRIFTGEQRQRATPEATDYLT